MLSGVASALLSCISETFQETEADSCARVSGPLRALTGISECGAGFIHNSRSDL